MTDEDKKLMHDFTVSAFERYFEFEMKQQEKALQIWESIKHQKPGGTIKFRRPQRFSVPVKE